MDELSVKGMQEDLMDLTDDDEAQKSKIGRAHV